MSNINSQRAAHQAATARSQSTSRWDAASEQAELDRAKAIQTGEPVFTAEQHPVMHQTAQEQHINEDIEGAPKWRTYFQQNRDGEADCGIFYERFTGHAYAIARCPRYVRQKEWLAVSNRIIACAKACHNIDEPEHTIAATKMELRHLIKLVGAALEDGVVIPGLATMNSAKRVLKLLGDDHY